jgi:hypothetical protein
MLVLGGVLAQSFAVLDGNSLQSYCGNSLGLMYTITNKIKTLEI